MCSMTCYRSVFTVAPTVNTGYRSPYQNSLLHLFDDDHNVSNYPDYLGKCEAKSFTVMLTLPIKIFLILILEYKVRYFPPKPSLQLFKIVSVVTFNWIIVVFTECQREEKPRTNKRAKQWGTNLRQGLPIFPLGQLKNKPEEQIFTTEAGKELNIQSLLPFQNNHLYVYHSSWS